MKDLLSNAKKILAVVLTLAMVCSGSTVSALAEELQTNTEEAVAVEADASLSDAADETDETEETEETEDTVVTEADSEEDAVQADAVQNDSTQADSIAEILASEEENTGVTSDNNGQAICSSLDGISSNTNLMRATLTTKFKTRTIKSGSTKYTESYTERTVKVTWKKPKGSTAKYYRLERINADGSEPATVLQNETDRRQRSRKSYTDKTDLKEIGENNTYLYVVTFFDKYGQQTSDAKIAAVASPTVLFAQTADDTSSTQVYFSMQKGPVNYIVERSDRSNSDKYYTNTVADVDVSALDGTAVVTTYNGTPAICVTDRTGSFNLGSSHYYRVKAYVKDLEAGNEIQSLPSKGYKVKSTLPAPELLSIRGTHDNNEVCYKNGTFQFTKLDVASGQDVKYVILRSLYPDRGFKAIKTVNTGSLRPIDVTSLNGTAVKGYEITYNKMTPTVPYYYRVRAIGKRNLSGAMSNDIQNTCQFAPVTNLEVESASIRQLNVSWKSEGCALKYVIERSGPYTSSPLDGQDTMVYKKRATVPNKPTSDGLIHFQDKSGLKESQWYCYKVYPVNGKYTGNRTAPAAGFTRIGNPTPKADGVNLNQINITWNKVDGAQSYTLQRTTTTDANGPVFTDASTIGTYGPNDTAFKKRTVNDKDVQPYVTYYYRMGASGKSGSSLIENAKVVSGYSRPMAVASLQATVRDTSSWGGNQVKFKTTRENHLIDSYVIYRQINEEGWEFIDSFANPTAKVEGKQYWVTRTDKDAGYAKGRTFTYKVCAVIVNGSQTLEGKPATSKIVLPKDLSLEDSSHTMKVGETYKVKVKSFSPSSTTFKSITYSIGNDSIVEKDDTGTDDGMPYVKVKARKVGKTDVKIKSRYSNISSTCTITVTN